jgi:hypothetical protein
MDDVFQPVSTIVANLPIDIVRSFFLDWIERLKQVIDSNSDYIWSQYNWTRKFLSKLTWCSWAEWFSVNFLFLTRSAVIDSWRMDANWALKSRSSDESMRDFRCHWRPRANFFEGIVTSDKSWFLHLYPSRHMFAARRNNVLIRENPGLGKSSILQSGYNQRYFLDEILLDCIHEKGRVCHGSRMTLWRKAWNFFHSSYSSDLSACDFWLFIILKTS